MREKFCSTPVSPSGGAAVVSPDVYMGKLWSGDSIYDYSMVRDSIAKISHIFNCSSGAVVSVPDWQARCYSRSGLSFNSETSKIQVNCT